MSDRPFNPFLIPGGIPGGPAQGGSAPGPDPQSGEWGDFVRTQLFDRRMLVVAGVLDEQRAGEVAAQLMTLDASGDGAITLQLDATCEGLDPAFTLIDTIDLLGVPVQATCIGRVEGPMVGVLAVAHRRAIAPHGRVHLCDPKATIGGSASDIERWAKYYADQLLRFQRRLAEATHRPLEQIEADMQAGRYFNAEEAVAYGIADEIARPTASIRRLPGTDRPFGFQAPH